MSEDKFTPGPWSRDKYGHVIGPNGESIAFRGVTISCSGPSDRITEAEANTNLAVAAPELFAEVEREYSELADIHSSWPGRDTPAGQQKLGRLRDLIAKATGRYPQAVQDDYGMRAAKARGQS